MKKENIVLRKLNHQVIFFKRTITEIYFDLHHIRYGWDSEKKDYKKGPPRNNYTENDVVMFFEQLNTLIQRPSPQKTTLTSVDERYVFYVYDQNIKLKMVVDFMKNNSTVVVTIH